MSLAESGATSKLDEVASAFVRLRPRLFGIAYRMLGDATEAEDLVQEVWLRWQHTDRAVVIHPAAFLATAVTRLAINVAQFLGGIVHSGTDGEVVRLSPAFVQPIASDDVALAMADYTLGGPVGGIVEIAGPERVRLADLVRRYMTATQDPREVVADAHARYFGARLEDDTLVPGPGPSLGTVNFETWLARSRASK